MTAMSKGPRVEEQHESTEQYTPLLLRQIKSEFRAYSKSEFTMALAPRRAKFLIFFYFFGV